MVLDHCAIEIEKPKDLVRVLLVRGSADVRSMADKFIIYGQSRSGSTLLVELVDRHPRIHCDGELMNIEAGHVRNRWLLRLLRRYPFPYIETMRRRASEPVYGFKLLFYQIGFARYALRRLRDEGWAFIRIHRRNVVEQALSKLIAVESRHWHRKAGQPTPSYRVTIEVGELEAELRLRAAWTRRERELLDGIEHLDLCYEDDLQREGTWPSTTRRVFDHLGVEATAVDPPDLLRTDERDYEEIILNHEEVITYLSASRYRDFLPSTLVSCA